MPNVGGRVVAPTARRWPAQYVTGWIRRGPTGVIGTNKHDAVEVAASVLADLPTLPPPAHRIRTTWRAVLAEHGVRPVDWTAWLRLDAEEIRLGQARGAERVKVAELAGDAGRGARRRRPGPSRAGELGRRPSAEIGSRRQRGSTAMTVGTSRSRSANSAVSSARRATVQVTEP